MLSNSSFTPRFDLNLLMVHKDCERKIDLFSYLTIYHVLKIKLFIISPDTMSGPGCERHGRRFTSVHQILLSKIPRGTGGQGSSNQARSIPFIQIRNTQSKIHFDSRAFRTADPPARGLSRVPRSTLGRPPRRREQFFSATYN